MARGRGWLDRRDYAVALDHIIGEAIDSHSRCNAADPIATAAQRSTADVDVA